MAFSCRQTFAYLRGGPSAWAASPLPTTNQAFEHVVLARWDEMTEAEHNLPENKIGNWGA